MRIDPNGRVGAPAARRTQRAGSGLGPGFSPAVETEPQAAAASVAGPASVGGLLAFQEVEDATAGLRRRAWRRATDLLDRLDQLKLGLLNGAVSRESLTSLAQLARSGRLATQDPGLDEVLGEIELRAAVEIAKLQRGA